MTSRSRGRWAWTGLLLAAVATAAGLAPAPSTSASSYSVVPAVGGRFVHTVTLDSGEVTIRPAPSSVTPRLTLSTATRQLWAVRDLAGYASGYVGLGLVTVSATSDVVPAIHRLLAWVGLATSAPLPDCGHASALSSGVGVVILGDAPGSPAAELVPTVGDAAQNSGVPMNTGCLADRPPMSLPLEVLSVPWRVVGRLGRHSATIIAQVPSCESEYGMSDDQVGTRLSVTVTVERYLRTTSTCPASPMTLHDAYPGSPPSGFIHGRVGPVSQVLSPVSSDSAAS